MNTAFPSEKVKVPFRFLPNYFHITLRTAKFGQQLAPNSEVIWGTDKAMA